MAENIRNIGIVGDDSFLFDITSANNEDNPPIGCACDQAFADGMAMMCMFCDDTEGHERYINHLKTKNIHVEER